MDADAIFLTATLAKDLQCLINATFEFCNWVKMTISAENTAVVKRPCDKAADTSTWTC